MQTKSKWRSTPQVFIFFVLSIGLTIGIVGVKHPREVLGFGGMSTKYNPMVFSRFLLFYKNMIVTRQNKF